MQIDAADAPRVLVPAAQIVQPDSPLEAEIVPATQLVQLAALAPLYKPASHWVQIDDADAPRVLVPAAQIVQPDAPLEAEIVPAAQLVHIKAPIKENLPAGHIVVQADAPSDAEMRPTAQCSHSDDVCAPVLAEYLPPAQFTHVDEDVAVVAVE